MIDICVKYGIPHSPQSKNIEQNSDGCISNFRISGQSFIKENCYNSRTSDVLTWNFGPITKLDKKKKTASKKSIMTSGWKIVTFLSFFQFMANMEQSGSRIPDGRVVCKTYIFIYSNILSYKNWKPNLKYF